eukprot:gene11576-24216_t
MESLNCPICYDRFTENGSHDPRVCPCGHTFCFTCLESFRVGLCAICRHEFPPGMTVTSLPRNLSVVSMLSEYRASSKNNSKSSLKQDISEMTSEQLIELQETVRKRIQEEKRKAVFGLLDANEKERNELRQSIQQREMQISTLKQLLVEEESELQTALLRYQDLEVQSTELLQRARLEDIVEVDTQEAVGTDNENTDSPHTLEQILLQPVELDGTEATQQSVVPPLALLPPPIPPVDNIRILRAGDRDRDRRRPRPGQVLPEPVDDTTNEGPNAANESVNTSVNMNISPLDRMTSISSFPHHYQYQYPYNYPVTQQGNAMMSELNDRYSSPNRNNIFNRHRQPSHYTPSQSRYTTTSTTNRPQTQTQTDSDSVSVTTTLLADDDNTDVNSLETTSHPLQRVEDAVAMSFPVFSYYRRQIRELSAVSAQSNNTTVPLRISRSEARSEFSGPQRRRSSRRDGTVGVENNTTVALPSLNSTL